MKDRLGVAHVRLAQHEQVPSRPTGVLRTSAPT